MCGLSPRFSWIDEHARQLAAGLGRTHEVAAASCRSPLGDAYSTCSAVIRASSGAHDLRFGELRTELVEQHRRGHAADRELRGLVEEAPAVECAVHVGVEENQQFLIEIVGGLALHVVTSRWRDEDTRQPRAPATRAGHEAHEPGWARPRLAARTAICCPAHAAGLSRSSRPRPRGAGARHRRPPGRHARRARGGGPRHRAAPARSAPTRGKRPFRSRRASCPRSSWRC